MNKIKFLSLSLVALLMACFTACENKYNVDHTAELVGTWTYIRANYAEALVFNADGTILSTGVEDGEYWENVAGTYVIKGNVVTMNFEDDDNVKGHIDVVPGIAFTVYEEDGENWTFNYCKEDLSDEILGMWVCNEGVSGEEKDMGIITYSEDGKAMFTGNNVTENNDNLKWLGSTYKVVGNILFQTISYPSNSGVDSYMASKLTYAPNSTSLGDAMTQTTYLPKAEGVQKSTSTWLRVKEGLDLAGKTYNYHDVFVTNVDGVDQEINILGDSFNFAKMDGSELDLKLRSTLFKVEFPKADTIKYTCRYSSELEASVEAPIAVDGNKFTIKMSEVYPSCKDVVLYTFQDADNSQMHMYMPTTSFINFFGNMQVTMMAQLGQLDLNDAAAVKAVYDTIDAAVNTINVSLLFKAK